MLVMRASCRVGFGLAVEIPCDYRVLGNPHRYYPRASACRGRRVPSWAAASTLWRL